MSDDLGPWPEKVYLLHPSVKTFGDMVTYPERREYVLAETAEAKLTKAVEALQECQAEIDQYIWHEYPLGHPVHERYRKRDLSANPARIALAELEGK